MLNKLNEWKDYVAKCEKDFTKLTQEATAAIDRHTEAGNKRTEDMTMLESPFGDQEIPLHPVTLDDGKTTMYDLFELIKRDAFDAGKIEQILLENPETREPIDLKMIKRALKTGLARQTHEATLRRVIRNAPQAELEPKAAEAPKIIEAPNPHAVIAHDELIEDQPYTLGAFKTILNDYEAMKQRDDFLPKIRQLCGLMTTIMLDKDYSITQTMLKDPVYPLDERVKVFMFFFNHFHKYQESKEGKEAISQFIEEISKFNLVVIQSLADWLLKHNVIKVKVKLYQQAEKIEPVKEPQPVKPAFSKAADTQADPIEPIDANPIKAKAAEIKQITILGVANAKYAFNKVLIPWDDSIMTVLDLKKRLLDSIGVPIENQKMMDNRSRTLQNHDQLSKLNLPKHPIILFERIEPEAKLNANNLFAMNPANEPKKQPANPAPEANPFAVARQVPPKPEPAPKPYPEPRMPGYDKFPVEAPVPHNQKVAPDRAVKHPEPDAKTPIYKILLKGDFGSGKSSLLNRYTEGSLESRLISTIGLEFRLKITEIPNQPNKNVRLQLWDPVGQDVFRAIANGYYRGARGIMLTFDLSDEKSFSNIKEHWLDELDRYAPENTPTLLVGCKSDLERKVDSVTAKKFAEDNGMSYVETSAKMDVNVDIAFNLLTEQIYAKEHAVAHPVIVDASVSMGEMIANFKNSKQLAFADFDVAKFNKLFKAERPDQDTRDSIRKLLVAAFDDKATKLINTTTSASDHLLKITGEMCALKKMKSTLHLIQPGFLKGTIRGIPAATQYEIDRLIKDLDEKARAVADNSFIAKFNLTLMKFKLIDYTSLDKLEPKPALLLDYLTAAHKGIAGITGMNPNEDAGRYAKRIHIITSEIEGLLEKGKLSNDQRSALKELHEHAISCEKIAAGILFWRNYTVADALRDAKSGVNPDPAPQQRLHK